MTNSAPRSLRFALSASLTLTTLAAAPARAHVDRRVRGRTSHVMAAGTAHALVIEHGVPFSGPATVGWGTNANGELGEGTAGANETRPVSVRRFTQVAAGQSFSLGIDGAGALWGWGVTTAGQTAVRLGTSAVTTPTQVAGTRVWKSITAGANHACGITAGGQLFCWGDNTMGELGQGTSSAASSTATPALVGAATDRWIAVAAGPQFTLGLQANGTAWAWGSNSTAGTESGQLGISDTASLLKARPVQIGSARWAALAAGGSHGLGIQEDGSLWAWGYNTAGELGTGNTTRKSGPVAIEVGSPFIAVAAGALDSFALRADGTLRAFGSNAAGQLGCPTCANPQKSPATVGTNYEYVVAGADFTLAMTAAGNVQTWGNNASGQLGRPGTANTPTPVPDFGGLSLAAIKPGMIAGGSSPSESADGQYNGARIKSSGIIETWGAYGALYGQKALGLASGQTGTINQFVDCDPTASICASPMTVAYVHTSAGNVIAPLPWRELSTGLNSMLAISSDGSLWGWGSNASGEVGNGTTTAVDLPVQLASSVPWLHVFMDPTFGYSVGIKADGSLWAWGAASTATPSQLCTTGACQGKRFATASPDLFGTLAIATDGTLWGWVPPAAPLAVNGSNPSVGPTGSAWANLTWLDVSVHGQDSEILDSSGSVWGWGYDVYGQIGDGTESSTAAHPLPVILQAMVMSNAVNVSSCSTTNTALDASGAMWAMGENGNKETGLNSSEIVWATDAFTGRQPATGMTLRTAWQPSPPIASSIACGGSDAFVLDDDGWVWALGSNDNGQLGLGYQGGTSQMATQDAPIYPSTFEPNGQSASVNNQNAACPNSGCGWSTSPANQASGQSFTIDLGAAPYQRPRFYTAVEFRAYNSANYPRAFKVLTSNDGVSFTQVATATGSDQTITVPFGLQGARYLRIQLTGSASVPWDIGSISVAY